MITVLNLHNNLAKIPSKYRADVPIILEAINSKLHLKDIEVNFVIEQILKRINDEISVPKPKTGPKPKAKKNTDIFDVEISKINIDKDRFQNRNKLNETVLNQIVENYSTTKLDPVVIWIDKDKKTYLLAGHHRLEATKRVGKKTIPAKYFDGTETEAIKYAKVESNANRSLELPQERAKVYREMYASGMTKKDIETEAKKLEGNNARYILNLSALNPKGIVIQALDQLSDTSDRQNATLIEKIADWIGEARKNNSEITNAHEKEMFDFLQDKSFSERIKTKQDFLQKIHAITGGFDFDATEPLNLKRFKNQTQGEEIYNEEYKTIQSKLDNLLIQKAELSDRIRNPKNANFIDPSSNDYDAVMVAYDNAISKVNNDIKATQQKLIELQRNKGSYIKAGSNQVGLFAPKKKETVYIFGMQKIITKKRQGSFGYTDEVTDVKNLTDIKKEYKNPDYRTIFFDKYGNDYTIDELKKYNVAFGEPKPIKKGLKNPIANVVANVITTAVLGEPETELQPISNNPNVKKIGSSNTNKTNFYTVAGEVGKFLQQVERKPVESVVITMDGQQGAGKTTTLYKFMDAFASPGNKCIFISGEEHPESHLAIDKANKLLSNNAKQNIDIIGEVSSIEDLYKTIAPYEIVFIDSWQKLQRMVGAIRLDEDLRKKFNGKVFVVIFQQTTTGRTKGGAEVVFDGDIIIKMVKEASFEDNFAYFDKNRYTLIPIENICYNIASGTTYNPNATEVEPIQQTENVLAIPIQNHQFNFIVGQ